MSQKMRVKDMPPEVRRVHDLLVKAERHAIHAWLIYQGIRPGSREGRVWYRWIKRGVAQAVRAFDKPTPEETARFIVSEMKRDVRALRDLQHSLRRQP